MLRFSSCRVVLFVIVALGLLGGCYESKFSLAPKEQAVLHREYLGDWEAPGENGSGKTHLVIRNWDDKQYYVEMDQPNQKPMRMAGFIIDLKGASFAHLRELRDDGKVSETYIIVRVALIGDDKLSLRHLDGKFFEGKTIESSADLRKLVEQNVDNDQMYDAQGTGSLTRVTN